MQTTFDEVVAFFGSQSALATVLGVDRAAVSAWRTIGIPPQRAIQIEVLSDGKFRAVDIAGAKAQ